MNKVTFITDDNGVEHAIIDRGNGEFTSMTKEHYDKLEVSKEDANKL